MRYLLTAAILLTAATAHGQWVTNDFLEVRITTLDGENTSAFGFPANAPVAFGTSSRGGVVRSYARSTTTTDIINSFGGYYYSALSPAGASIELIGSYQLTPHITTEYELWTAAESVNVELSGMGFYRQWLESTRDTITLPRGTYNLTYTLGWHNDGSLTETKRLPASGISLQNTARFPEPSSVVLLLACVVLAVAAKRNPLVLRPADKRAGAV